ncbi:hypothetical protein QZH41_003284 [Actinostola sp. cb2023]|nr:hypothetical protein QZH41_003284 [Actinostola sp. cb2023]
MMAYEKSIINIDINFENEPFMAAKPAKPTFAKKIPKDRITIIQPSVESKKTDMEIAKRLSEVEKFRRESQSAVDAPLLVKALIKKTYSRLKAIKVMILYTGNDTIYR